MNLSPDEDLVIRSFCQAVICDRAPAPLDDPVLQAIAEDRLGAVGMRVAVVKGRIWALALSEDPDDPGAYNDVQLAALALCCVHLLDARPANERFLFADLHRLMNAHGKWSKEWLRRAVIAPLERDGYIHMVEPGARRSDAYLEPGPRLGLIDRRALLGAAAEEAA